LNQSIMWKKIDWEFESRFWKITISFSSP
jgi:hypothetical protein